MVCDALTSVFDHAVIIAHGTDQVEPIRIVVDEEVDLSLTLVTPEARAAEDLRKRLPLIFGILMTNVSKFILT